MKRYITTLVLVREADDIGQVAGEVTEHITKCFVPNGFSVLQGDISRARENTPIEQLSLASTEAYINESAHHGLTGMEVIPTDGALLGMSRPRAESAP